MLHYIVLVLLCLELVFAQTFNYEIARHTADLISSILEGTAEPVRENWQILSRGQALTPPALKTMLLQGMLGNPWPIQTALYVATEAGAFHGAVFTQPATFLPYAKYYLTYTENTPGVVTDPMLGPQCVLTTTNCNRSFIPLDANFDPIAVPTYVVSCTLYDQSVASFVCLCVCVYRERDSLRQRLRHHFDFIVYIYIWHPNALFTLFVLTCSLFTFFLLHLTLTLRTATMPGTNTVRAPCTPPPNSSF
jgi:hypothetical protein